MNKKISCVLNSYTCSVLHLVILKSEPNTFYWGRTMTFVRSMGHRCWSVRSARENESFKNKVKIQGTEYQKLLFHNDTTLTRISVTPSLKKKKNTAKTFYRVGVPTFSRSIIQYTSQKLVTVWKLSTSPLSVSSVYFCWTIHLSRVEVILF